LYPLSFTLPRSALPFRPLSRLDSDYCMSVFTQPAVWLERLGNFHSPGANIQFHFLVTPLYSGNLSLRAAPPFLWFELAQLRPGCYSWFFSLPFSFHRFYPPPFGSCHEIFLSIDIFLPSLQPPSPLPLAPCPIVCSAFLGGFPLLWVDSRKFGSLLPQSFSLSPLTQSVPLWLSRPQPVFPAPLLCLPI